MTLILAGALLALHLTSLALAGWRLRRRMAVPETAPHICLMVPVCGIDAFAEETLESFFRQHYPDYSLIFCVASAHDPVIAVLQRLMARHPARQAELLVGDDGRMRNPKLSNLLKGWERDRSEWVAIIDSNALAPRNYLAALVAAKDGAGLVSSPAIGTRPEGIWGATEAAFLNTHQARWQFLADLFGAGFAQGKTLFVNRAHLDRAGGFNALGSELAEDVAATKLMRNIGSPVRLVAQPIAQPIGRRLFAEVWGRQLRWARIRRQGFPALFLPEILLGGALPLLLLLTIFPLAAPLGMVLWYGAEWALARANGWPASWRDVGAMMMRDLLMPAIYLWSWKSRQIAWRGRVIDAEAA